MSTTSLVKVGGMSLNYSKGEIYFKDESQNVFGTYKDRRSKYILKKANKLGIKKLVLITSGNAGYSLCKLSQEEDFKVVCIVDKKLKKSIKNKLAECCYKLVETSFGEKFYGSEEMIELARDEKDEKIMEVTHGFFEPYEEIIREIKDEHPDYIICPVGTGEAFVGFSDAIKKLGMKAKLVGVGTVNLDKSFADKLPNKWLELDNRFSKASKENLLVKLTEEEIKESYESFKKKYSIEPSAAVVFGALSKFEYKKEDKIILINSGKGLF